MDDFGDEAARSDPRRLDSPAFEDRHPFLHPQNRFFAICMAKQETGPAGIAGMRREQFGEGGSGRRGQLPALAQTPGETMNGRPGADGDGSAGDQR